VSTSFATSRSSSTTRMRPPRAVGRWAGAASCSIMCNEDVANGVPFVRKRARLPGLVQRGVYLRQAVGDERRLGPDFGGPRRKEQPVGLVLDALPRRRALGRCPRRAGLDETALAKTRESRVNVLGALVRQKCGQPVLIRGLVTPDTGEQLDFWTVQPRSPPGRHVAVVAHLPQPVDRGV